MSGPKSYSVQVFDKYLKELFLLQSEIRLLWNDLTGKEFSSEKHQLKYNTNHFISKHKAEFTQHTDPFIFRATDDMSHQMFDTYYNHQKPVEV